MEFLISLAMRSLLSILVSNEPDFLRSSRFERLTTSKLLSR